jgi:hypothetical protein
MDSAWAFCAAYDEARKIRDAQDAPRPGYGMEEQHFLRACSGNRSWMCSGEESRCAILVHLCRSLLILS